MRTYLQAKEMAKSLRDSLAPRNVKISHGECLDIVSRLLGFGNWNILAAKIEIDTRVRQPVREPAQVEMIQLIPVLRVASRRAAREFYVGVLGFEFDWGDEGSTDGHAFYAQVSRDELQIHLTTEGPPRAGTDVYFRVKGIVALLAEVNARLEASHRLAIHHTNYDSRELSIDDPFGNRLRFVENNPPGVSAPPH